MFPVLRSFVICSFLTLFLEGAIVRAVTCAGGSIWKISTNRRTFGNPLQAFIASRTERGCDGSFPTRQGRNMFESLLSSRWFHCFTTSVLMELPPWHVRQSQPCPHLFMIASFAASDKMQSRNYHRKILKSIVVFCNPLNVCVRTS